MAQPLLCVVPVWISTTDTGEAFDTLGERIVKAARLAVAVHLYQSVASRQRQPTEDEPAARRQRRVVIGGAGPRLVESHELT